MEDGPAGTLTLRAPSLLLLRLLLLVSLAPAARADEPLLPVRVSAMPRFYAQAAPPPATVERPAPVVNEVAHPPIAAGACTVDDDCGKSGYCDNDGTCSTTSYLPWLVRTRDRSRARTTTVVGPFVRVADAAGATTLVLPLIYSTHDNASDRTTTIGFPVFLWHTGPSERGGLFGPIYGFSDEKGWVGGAFPLLFLGDRDGRSHQALVPLFYHHHDRKLQADTLALGPLYWHTEREAWDGGLVPLVFAGHHDKTTYASVLGLYNFRKNEHGQRHILGPLYADSRDDGYAFGLAPLVHFSSSPTGSLRWIVPPLYFHYDDGTSNGRSFSMAGPLFSERSEEGTTKGLFPLLWSVRRGSRKWDLALPVAGAFSDADKKTSALWVGPYIRLRDERRERTTQILLPIGVKHDAPDYHVLVQFPFYWSVDEGAEHTRAIFPFYLGVRQPDLVADVGFPLYWKVSTPRSTTTLLGSAFYRTTPERRDAGILPLAGYGGSLDGKHSYAWFAPLGVWHDSDEDRGTSRTIALTFLWERRTDGWTSTLLPLWTAWRRGSQARWITPLVYHGEDVAADTALTIAGPIYFGHDAHARRAGLFPLFFSTLRDDHSWSATLLPIFSAARKPDGGSRFVTPLGGWSTSPAGYKGFLGPFYIRRDTTVSSTAFMPFFYHGVDRDKDQTTTVVPPLFFRRVDRDRSLLGVTPLFWQYATIDSTTSVGFPLFYDHHIAYESRTTALLPLFVRSRTYAADESSWLLPPLLLYWHTSKTDTDISWLFLFWHFSSPGSVSTALFPLYWNIERGTSTTRVLFPVFVHAHRDDANYTLVFNFYYRRGLGKEEGSYSWNIIPLFDFGRPKAGDVEWNFLEGLVGYSRRGSKRTLKLFYAVDVPLAPANSRTSFVPPILDGKSASASLF